MEDLKEMKYLECCIKVYFILMNIISIAIHMYFIVCMHQQACHIVPILAVMCCFT